MWEALLLEGRKEGIMVGSVLYAQAFLSISFSRSRWCSALDSTATYSKRKASYNNVVYCRLVVSLATWRLC